MHEIDRQKFGAFVAQLRKEKGCTQKELAQRLYISDKAVSKWETGVSIPDTAMLMPLSELLGVTVTELLLCRRQTPDESMERETVEQVVKAAVLYNGKGGRRAWQQKSRWPAWYALSLLVGAAAMLANYRMGVRLEALWTTVLLGAVFGAYFCFFAPVRLPEVYDRYKIGLIYDGVFRMNVPGVHFNNRNWPHVMTVLRIWACAMMAWIPLLTLALAVAAPALLQHDGIWLAIILVLALGGLFVPIYVAGRRYES